MDKIYTVEGSTGEYSDRYDWIVRAFASEEKAKAYLLLIETAYKQFDQRECGYQRSNSEELHLTMKVLDPSFNEDYTGTYYHLSEIDYDPT